MSRAQYAMDTQFVNWRRRPTSDAAVNMYFGACVGQMLATLLGRLLMVYVPALSGLGVTMSVTVLFQTLCLLAPVLVYCANRPGMAKGLRVQPCGVMPMVLSGLAAVSGLLFADGLGTLWLVLLEALGADIAGGMGFAGAPILAQLAFCALLPAVCEEMMFRGMMLSAFERQGRRTALFLSALLFALIHVNLKGLPVQFAMGVALGYIVLRSGSLYPAVFFHLLFNGLSLLLSTGASGEQTLLEEIGGGQGILGCVLRLLLYGALTLGLIAGIQGNDAEEAQPGARREMKARTIIVLCAGIVTTLCVGLVNALGMWGVL